MCGPDLAEVHARHAITPGRCPAGDAVAKRRRTHQRTARENVEHLCDEGTFIEHGQLVLTPGTGLPLEETIRKFPTDGMVTGIGAINGDLFGPQASRWRGESYDYTVLARHPRRHQPSERPTACWSLPRSGRIPMVLFRRGGRRVAPEPAGVVRAGPPRRVHRPHPNPWARFDAPSPAARYAPPSPRWGRLSGLVPMVGITSRYCLCRQCLVAGLL